VRGAALVGPRDAPTAIRAVGDCATWIAAGLPPAVVTEARAALASGQPALRGAGPVDRSVPAFTAVLPLPNRGESIALVVIGDVAAPFAALDDGILVTVGQQIGAALEALDLTVRLEERSADLERLAQRMITVHEEMRRRLARELHDETAQVFSALKLQLGALRETAAPELTPRFGRLIELVDAGTRSIRGVTDDLRPPLLDDLGLIPALRALTTQFAQWSGLGVQFEATSDCPPLEADANLAAFRAVQEGLSNAARHAAATEVRVRVEPIPEGLRVQVDDDGNGVEPPELGRLTNGSGRSGLFGLHERITQVGGRLVLSRAVTGGLRLEVVLPAAGVPA
jgi:signal transduction histidine kinase